MAILFWLTTAVGYALFALMAAVVLWSAWSGKLVLTDQTSQFWIAIIGAASAAALFLLGKLTEQLVDFLQRDQRTKDLVTALHAEISASLQSAALQTAPKERDYLRRQEVPFGPSDKTDFVYYSIQQDLTIMPIEVIHEVVRYYKLAAQSNLMTDDLKHPLYARQKRSEKQKYAESLIAIMEEQVEAAKAALAALDAYGRQVRLPDLAAKRRSGIRPVDG
jgi:hypothetical protein